MCKLSSTWVIVLVMAAFGGLGYARTLEFENRCSYSVWPGVLPDVARNGGWEMAPGAKTSIDIPDNFVSGRFWGRTKCDENSGHCQTGDCGNKIQCAGAGGIPPVTLAEFTLGRTDFFDVSLVDGFNLPLSISPIGGSGPKCHQVGCYADINAVCPEELQIKHDGKVVQCSSACHRFNTDQYCCRGQHGTPQTCLTADWPVDSAYAFKHACPQAYSYAYDDQSSTFTCSGEPDYKIVFCG